MSRAVRAPATDLGIVGGFVNDAGQVGEKNTRGRSGVAKQKATQY